MTNLGTALRASANRMLLLGSGELGKEVAIEAQRLGIGLPVTEQVDSFYGQVQEMGGARWDTSSLFARMQKYS